MIVSFLKMIVVALVAACVAAGCYYGYYKLWVEPRAALVAQQLSAPLPAMPPDPTVKEFEQAMEIHKTGTPQEAQAALQRFINDYPQSTSIEAAVDALGELNSTLFFSKENPQFTAYSVRSGDTLTRISTQKNVPMELLVYLNGLTSNRLKIGQPLRILSGTFSLSVIQKSRRVVLLRDGKFFRSYPAIEWNGKEKNAAPTAHPKQAGKIGEKLAFKDGTPVRPDETAYFEADHQILLTVPVRAIYTHRIGPDGKTSPRPPGGGFGLAPAHMSEISVLLRRGNAVSLE
jgi:LysM repeat protein